MRRSNREIKDRNDILEVMKKCDVCSVAFWDEQFPYIIPMNFGVTIEDESVIMYFHGANKGTKLELLKKNPAVGFEMNCSHELIIGEADCDTTMHYESVCGNGFIEIVNDDDKIKGLSVLMQQYVPKESYHFDEKLLKRRRF